MPNAKTMYQLGWSQSLSASLKRRSRPESRRRFPNRFLPFFLSRRCQIGRNGSTKRLKLRKTLQLAGDRRILPPSDRLPHACCIPTGPHGKPQGKHLDV